MRPNAKPWRLPRKRWPKNMDGAGIKSLHIGPEYVMIRYSNGLSDRMTREEWLRRRR